MNHQLEKLIAHQKLHGTLGMSVALGARILDALGCHISGSDWLDQFLDQRFDSQFGVETSQQIPVSELGVSSARETQIIHYEATPAIEYFQLLNTLKISSGTTFVDIGCGKGKALLIASLFPFSSLEGVELSADVVEQCQQNLHAADHRGRVLPEYQIYHQDATEYAFPETDLVIYMFNPFNDVIMNQVLDNLETSLDAYPRKVTVLYCNAQHRHCFEKRSCWVSVERPFRLKDWWASYEYYLPKNNKVKKSPIEELVLSE